MENERRRGIDPSRFRREATATAPVRARQPAPQVAQPRVVTPESLAESLAEPLSESSTRKNRRWLHRSAIGLIVIIVLGGGGFGLFKVLKPAPPIPKTITSKVSFVILFPADNSVVNVDKRTIKYDPASKVLSFVAKEPNGTKLTYSEQSLPASFTDVPQTFDALTAKLNVYSTIEGVNGKVQLTHPKELNGVQAAVMNAKGTLLFARPSKNLSDDNWRQAFNNLQITK